jgi:hypothetical protein
VLLLPLLLLQRSKLQLLLVQRVWKQDLPWLLTADWRILPIQRRQHNLHR